MAAATLAVPNRYDLVGTRWVVTAQFTSPADGDTWDTGLPTIDHASFTILEASGSAADAISAGSIAGAVITLDVQGTVDAALARAEGV